MRSSFVALSRTLRSTNMAGSILPCSLASVSFPSTSSVSAVPEITDEETLKNLRTAAAALRNNELVAFPTETVYGLGGNALAGSSAIKKIYTTKGRPSDNPLIVHISSTSQLNSLVDPALKATLPISYPILMDKFWPGPLTLLFPTLPGELVSENVTCGLRTVAVRMPAHPVARALIALADLPIAAPSANTSGRPSPTTAKHVERDLNGKPDLTCILDGGNCDVGLESTVVSALGQKSSVKGKEKEVLQVLRLGGVSPEELQTCLVRAGLAEEVELQVATHPPSHTSTNGEDSRSDKSHVNGNGIIPSTPGMKYKHYSPDAKVILVRITSDATDPQLSKALSSFSHSKIGLLHLESTGLHAAVQAISKEVIPISLGSPRDFVSHAQRLFSGLRALDEADVDVILVECMEEEELGRTVMERLRKSAGNVEPVDVRI